MAAIRRVLGTRDITLFAIALTVGTRWIATAAHIGPGAILLWVLAAIFFMVPLAIGTAALTVRHPHTGGIYIWARHDFGPWHGFLCFWLYWMGAVVWFPGAALFYVGAAAGVAGTAGTHLADNRVWLVTASVALIWIALGANIFGVKSGQRVADLGAVCSWLLAAVLCVAAFVFHQHHAAATPFHLLPAITWKTIGLFATIAYAMTGLEAVGLMGAEIREPARTLPRAAWMASIFVALYYAGSTAAVLVLLPSAGVSELQGLTQAGSAAASALGIPWLPRFIALLIFATAIGQFGALGSSNSRLPYAAGTHGLMPRGFGQLHPKWGTPHISILTLAAVSSSLLLLMQIGDTMRAAYDTIVSLMVIVGFLPYIYMFGSAWLAGRRCSAASGMGVTLLAIVFSLIPPDGVTNIWLFEGKLLLGTAGFVGAGWLVYRRNAAVSSSNVISPG